MKFAIGDKVRDNGLGYPDEVGTEELGEVIAIEQGFYRVLFPELVAEEKHKAAIEFLQGLGSNAAAGTWLYLEDELVAA